MDDYEGSPELDVDLELLSVYEKRLERAIRVKDKVRRLARHHKVFLSDVQKLHDNLDRAKTEADQALEAKKKMLISAIERRFEEAKESVVDEMQAKKMPLEQAVADMKRSSAVLEAALETLEDKLKEPQHQFIQRFIPMVEEIESHVTHAQSLRSEYDTLVDDDLVLACVDDFCRLTVRHRVKKVAGPGGNYGALGPSSPQPAAVIGSSVNDLSASSLEHQALPRRHKPQEQFLSKRLAVNEEPNAREGKFLSRKLATPSSDGTIPGGTIPAGGTRSRSRPPRSAQTEHLKDLVHEAYNELEDLYDWLRRSGVSKYGVGGLRDSRDERRPARLGPA